MPRRLIQVLVNETDVKQKVEENYNSARRVLKQEGLFLGKTRTYKPFRVREGSSEEEEGEETQTARVQIKVDDILKAISNVLTDLFDTTAEKDWGNTRAVADVKIGDRVVLKGVPATYLLWLEKQLAIFAGLLKDVPTLSQASEWTYNKEQGLWVSSPDETIRTKKVPMKFEKSPATDKFPAQVEILYEDMGIGKYRETKFSGALPPKHLEDLQQRLFEVQRAVKDALQEANTVQVEQQKIGEKLFGYILG